MPPEGTLALTEETAVPAEGTVALTEGTVALTERQPVPSRVVPSRVVPSRPVPRSRRRSGGRLPGRAHTWHGGRRREGARAPPSPRERREGRSARAHAHGRGGGRVRVCVYVCARGGGGGRRSARRAPLRLRVREPGPARHGVTGCSRPRSRLAGRSVGRLLGVRRSGGGRRSPPRGRGWRWVPGCRARGAERWRRGEPGGSSAPSGSPFSSGSRTRPGPPLGAAPRASSQVRSRARAGGRGVGVRERRGLRGGAAGGERRVRSPRTVRAPAEATAHLRTENQKHLDPP